VATSPALTQQSLPGGPLWPYPNRSSTGWIAPASPGAFVKFGYKDLENYPKYDPDICQERLAEAGCLRFLTASCANGLRLGRTAPASVAADSRPECS
jgi:hypothetical protein